MRVTPAIDVEEGTTRFDEFLSQKQYRQRIFDLSDQYPQHRSLYVDFEDIESYDLTLSDFILYRSHMAFECADNALNLIIPPEHKDISLNLRITNLPHTSKFSISKLRASELGHLVSIEGLVRRVTEVRPRLLLAIYECARCGVFLKEEQESWHPKEPLECYKEQGGCLRTAASTRFKLKLEISGFVDSQKIEIQEPPEVLIPGSQPERMACYAEQDITGKVNPGDRIIVNGTLKARQRSFPMKSTMLDTYVLMNSIETQERVYEEIIITAEDERKILELSRHDRCYTNIIDSIVPTIHGMRYEKEAVALQLFGGIPKDMPDGSRLRGDIHILLVGDPGIAKSTILRAVSKIAPKGIFTSGKTTSGVGLVASVVKDDFGEGRWTVEAGAMALADRGHLCADELDKMDPKDRLAMHEAMAQQEVYISKAGIHTMIHTRTPVLAAANPKRGRFDPTEYILGQVNMPPALLSRFDLIFSILDIPEPERDSQIAKHILDGEIVGQVTAHKSIVGDDEYQIENIAELMKVFKPTIEPEMLRKYIAFAKRSIVPVMGEDAMNRMADYYLHMRKMSSEEGAAIAITPRQLQAIVRLSEASARLHLSNTVEVGRDVERAIRITEYYLRNVASEDGRFDIDIVESGTSQSQRERIKTIHGIIRDLAAIEQPIDRDDIVREAEAYQISRGQTEAAIKRLLFEDGAIYEAIKGSGKYRLAK